ncbi:unnamed protein product [Cunninghamella blakesleeana]
MDSGVPVLGGNVVGGWRKQEDENDIYVQNALDFVLKNLNENREGDKKFKFVSFDNIEQQTVAGINTLIEFFFTTIDETEGGRCSAKVNERSWENKIEILEMSCTL